MYKRSELRLCKQFQCYLNSPVMSLKNVHYQRLETEESDGEEDESPPTHVELHNSHYVKGNRWNHIENLDEFFERIYEYQQQHGLAAIVLTDVFELIQFMFMVLLTTIIVTCLRFSVLWADTVPVKENNITQQRDVIFRDLFDFNRIERINPIVVLFLLLSFAFWVHRLFRACIRFYRFWEIRTFYIEALNIRPSDLHDVTWSEVAVRLKDAQREYKMNIRKQELSELDIYHRILRFKNYLVAMINKSVLPCKFKFPLYGDKVFFTQGLKFNYELLLFWPSLKAPFQNSYYLREEYKSASKKAHLVANLRFRITILALINFIFFPIIMLYQIIYSFFNYAELLKRQPGVFGRRRWSLYGQWHLRDFNELDHELNQRLCRAYKPSVKYMDLFTHPLLVIVSKNVAFFAGAILALLLTLTVIQEDLLTAHNVLTIMTLLGLIITACRIFIPNENQVRCPTLLMHRILGDIHYMPDHWKQRPHTLEVYREYTQVFQFTMMYILDELMSPIVTPFVLYFSLRNKAGDIVDFLRNFTIDVSGVGDVCSFAEMNVRKHGSPEWLSSKMSRAGLYEQAEMGKTEISLMNFSRKNPNWKPSEAGAAFMSQLKESVEEVERRDLMSSQYGGHRPPGPLHEQPEEESLSYLTLNTGQGYSQQQQQQSFHPAGHAPCDAGDPNQWSIWSIQPSQPHYNTTPRLYPSLTPTVDPMVDSTLQLHKLHDHMKLQSSSVGVPASTDPTQTLAPSHPVTVYSSQASIEEAWRVPQQSGEQVADERNQRTTQLNEPLLQPVPTLKIPEHHVQFATPNDDNIDPGLSSDTTSRGVGVPYVGIREHGLPYSRQETTVVELHNDDVKRD